MGDRWPAAHIHTKISVGVILCRQNADTNRIEALLVHKRYTYAFAEFVLGKYAIGVGSIHKSVINLVSHMTKEELFDVLSLKFEQMWYRIWLSYTNSDLYKRKYTRFHTAFIASDGGIALKKLIMTVQATNILMWEVPKGRRISSQETDIVCAIRELHEETGIEKNDYRFLPGAKRCINYVSAGVRYICIYYIAIANPHLSSVMIRAKPALRDINFMAEVDEHQWFDVERIRFIDGQKLYLSNLILPAFKLIRKYLKGQWTSRPLRNKIFIKPPPPIGVSKGGLL